jgi:hypothetical protein
MGLPNYSIRSRFNLTSITVGRKCSPEIFCFLKETKYFNRGLALKCKRKLHSDIRQDNVSGRLFY